VSYLLALGWIVLLLGAALRTETATSRA
jgi:hypothetical protein